MKEKHFKKACFRFQPLFVLRRVIYERRNLLKVQPEVRSEPSVQEPNKWVLSTLSPFLAPSNDIYLFCIIIFYVVSSSSTPPFVRSRQVKAAPNPHWSKCRVGALLPKDSYLQKIHTDQCEMQISPTLFPLGTQTAFSRWRRSSFLKLLLDGMELLLLVSSCC